MPAADLTRQRLVHAALELFSTRGYAATTTAEIARKAGVAEGTIYRHFQSKQHLLNELYRGAARWALRLVREAEGAAGGGGEGPPARCGCLGGRPGRGRTRGRRLRPRALTG